MHTSLTGLSGEGLETAATLLLPTYVYSAPVLYVSTDSLLLPTYVYSILNPMRCNGFINYLRAISRVLFSMNDSPSQHLTGVTMKSLVYSILNNHVTYFSPKYSLVETKNMRRRSLIMFYFSLKYYVYTYFNE